MGRHSVSQVRAVAAVVAALVPLAAVSISVVVGHDTQAVAGPSIPWWLVAAMFAITEIVVLDVQVRREAQTISLSEIPLVLGLLFAPPGAVVLGRLLGPLTVFVTHRQSPPLKIAYNVVQQTTSAAVASAVYVVVSGPAAFPDPRALGALYLATAVAALTDGIALRVVIGLYEGVLRLRDLLTEAVTYPPISLMVATFGIVAGYALQHDPMSVYPLLACVGIVLLGYRAYAALSGRHLSLERLYQFSQALSETPEVDHVLSEALGRAKDLLRADLAEILFLASEGSAAALVSLDAGDRLHRRTVTTDILPAGMRSALVVDGGTVLIPRRSKDAEHKAYLGERGFRDAILAPLRGEAGVTAVLTVADRMGDVRSFDQSDVLLLETVANHAGVALQNGRLIDQLRHQALHDALTGLPNRVLITRRIAEALVGVEDDGAPGVAAMIMDLDGFKEVNDTLGHQHGDRLLVEVAERLRTAGGDEALVARLGGDEFAVLLPNCPDLEYAAQIGQRLLQSLELPVHLDDLDVAVGALARCRDRTAARHRRPVAAQARRRGDVRGEGGDRWPVGVRRRAGHAHAAAARTGQRAPAGAAARRARRVRAAQVTAHRRRDRRGRGARPLGTPQARPDRPRRLRTRRRALRAGPPADRDRAGPGTGCRAGVARGRARARRRREPLAAQPARPGPRR
jgi:diguanylate cyclase (GGDEF)-like protein